MSFPPQRCKVYLEGFVPGAFKVSFQLLQVDSLIGEVAVAPTSFLPRSFPPSWNTLPLASKTPCSLASLATASPLISRSSLPPLLCS